MDHSQSVTGLPLEMDPDETGPIVSQVQPMGRAADAGWPTGRLPVSEWVVYARENPDYIAQLIEWHCPEVFTALQRRRPYLFRQEHLPKPPGTH